MYIVILTDASNRRTRMTHAHRWGDRSIRDTTIYYAVRCLETRRAGARAAEDTRKRPIPTVTALPKVTAPSLGRSTRRFSCPPASGILECQPWPHLAPLQGSPVAIMRLRARSFEHPTCEARRSLQGATQLAAAPLGCSQPRAGLTPAKRPPPPCWRAGRRSMSRRWRRSRG